MSESEQEARSSASNADQAESESATNKRNLWIGLAVMGVLTWTANIFEPEPAPKMPAEQCRQDITCWAQQHISEIYACEKQVESKARFAFRWKAWLHASKFPYAGWANKASGTIRYSGEKLEFQNAFGVWQQMSYSCDFDPASRRALSVTVSSAR